MGVAAYGQPALLQLTLQRHNANVTQARPPVVRRYRDAKGVKRTEKVKRKPLTRAGRIEGFRFPVNPENIDIRMGRETVDLQLLTRGVVKRPGLVTPVEITFSSFFPDPDTTQQTSWLNVALGELAEPWETVQALRAWQKAEGPDEDRLTPLKLTIADAKLTYWVTMTQFDVQTRPGPGDVYFTMTLIETSTLPDLERTAKRVNPKPKAERYVTKGGGNVVSATKAHYGNVDSAMVSAVYKANAKRIGPDRTRRLPAGTVLVMPKGLKPAPVRRPATRISPRTPPPAPRGGGVTEQLFFNF